MSAVQVSATNASVTDITNPNLTLTSSLLNNATNIVAYAHDRVTAVDGFLSGLTAQVLTLVAPTITPVFPTVQTAPAPAVAAEPVVTNPVFVAPGIPAAFTTVLVTGDLDIQPFDTQPPTLVYGTAPPPFAGALPDAPSVNLQFTYPELSVTLPAAPPLLSVDTIAFNAPTLPVLTAQAPDTIWLTPPQITNYTPGSQYTSALLTDLKTYLQGVISNGTSGLTRPGEEAIFARGLEKEAYNQADALLKIDQMEGLGYMFAPGIWLDARLKIIQQTDAAQRGYAREVTAQSVQLNLDQIKDALQNAVGIETQLINYNNQVEQRLFEAAKYVTEAGVSIYNAKVQAYQAMTTVYATKIEAYKAQVQAALTVVEIYKAQIEAERVKAEINVETIKLYEAQISAAMTNVEIWKAELSGIQIKADIEKTKVQLFGEFVQAYGMQVNAYSANVEAYKATLQAEATKQQVYSSQVDAYSALVTSRVKVLDARIETFKAQISAKELEYEGYKTAVAGASAQVDAEVRTQGLLVDMYRANISSTQSYNELLTKQWQVALDQSERVAQIGVSAAESQAQLYVSTRGLALEAAKASAQVSAQIAAAGINAVNYSGSVSSSESYGVSTSTSTSASGGSSYSTSLSASV